MTLHHLVLGCQGERPTEIDEPAQFFIAQIIAVDDVHARPDQAFRHEYAPAFGRSRRTAALVHRCDEPELACQSKVMQCDIEGRIMRPENGEAESHQSVAAGERSGQQPLDLRARVRQFGKMRLARFGIGFRRAMKERRANAAFRKC